MSIENKVNDLAEKVEKFEEKHASESSGPLGYSWSLWIFSVVVCVLIKYFEVI
jgi:hypothetical protein